MFIERNISVESKQNGNKKKKATNSIQRKYSHERIEISSIGFIINNS